MKSPMKSARYLITILRVLSPKKSIYRYFRKNLKLIMENPYSEEHFLRRYWCYLPKIIDKDRRDSGDYFAKPTQYWFLNCEPKNNLIFEAITYNSLGVSDAIRTMKPEDYKKTGAKNQKVARSMIHPDYANRFIRQYILDESEKKNEMPILRK